jgi:hypothetical protein
MSYINIVIRTGPLPILETCPPVYRGQERTERDKLKASQVYTYVYFRYTPCLTDLTFEFIRHPTSPILSPSYWTFVELTLVSKRLDRIVEKKMDMEVNAPGVHVDISSHVGFTKTRMNEEGSDR